MAQDKQPTRIVLRRFKNHYRQTIDDESLSERVAIWTITKEQEAGNE